MTSDFLDITPPAWAGPESIPLADIQQKIFTRPKDIVVVAGSVVEGMGSFLSDIDVCVLTEAKPTLGDVKDRGHFLVSLSGTMGNWAERLRFGSEMHGADDVSAAVNNTYDFVDMNGTRCDVEYLLRSDIEVTLEKIERGFRHAGTRYGWIAEPASLESLRYVHRLYTGICLANDDSLGKLLSGDYREKLAYLLFRGSCFVYRDFQDILGSTLSSNVSQAVLLIRSYLWMHLKALTHLYGNSNPTNKWAAVYGDRIFGSDSEVMRRFSELFQGTKVTKANLRSYITSCLDFGDFISQMCIEKMDSVAIAYSSETMVGLMRRRIKDAGFKDPHLLMSLEFHSKMFNRKSLPSRDFLEMKEGLTRCTFV